MRLRLIQLSFFALLLVQQSKSQGTNPGDTWPDLEFKEVMNYSRPVLRLSDFKGKALLISVWAHFCRSCIEAFPLLDSMQEKFKDRLQIILLNPETADSTRRFFLRKNKLHQPKIVPMVTGETELAKKLNALGELWLDSARVFHFGSEIANITAENIQKFLAGIPLTFKKRVKLAEFDTSVPLIAEGGGRWIDSISSYAYFFHHPFELPRLNKTEPGGDSPANELRFANAPVLTLYKLAFNEKNKYDFTDATTEVHVRDSSLFFPPKGDSESYSNWYNEHLYTYDSRVPLPLANRIYQLMQQSLPFRFGPKAEVQLLERNCWVLQALDSTRFISKKGRSYRTDGIDDGSDSVSRFQHWPSERIFSTIKTYYQRFSSQPLINRLNYSGPMNFSIDLGIIVSGKMERFREALKENGLVLRQQKMKVPVLVIQD